MRCIQRFLFNELETSEDREAALAVFASAVMTEREEGPTSDVCRGGSIYRCSKRSAIIVIMTVY